MLGTIVVAFLSLALSRRLLRLSLAKFFTRTTATWDDIFFRRGVFEKLAWLAPAIVIYVSIYLFAHHAERTILLLLQAYTTFVFMLILSALLTAVNDIYSTTETAKDVPIKGYLQVVKLLVYIAGTIVIVAVIFRKSPWVFLSGLGAATAVLLLVFKDTLLSFVASIQLATNDMIRIGDWIDMPKYNADGEVVDIALHTVKVRNWDLTITTIPTFKLIEDSFKNWRSMQAGGARRIKRAIYIDIASIHFIDEPEGARTTNIGKFRAYLSGYIRANPKLRQDMSLVVRELAPSPQGLPLEIYAFVAVTIWPDYEEIQAEIFDHALAVLPEFGLRVFQNPTGYDLAQRR
jgi:miniconductance mechanosensitive channel